MNPLTIPFIHVDKLVLDPTKNPKKFRICYNDDRIKEEQGLSLYQMKLRTRSPKMKVPFDLFPKVNRSTQKKFMYTLTLSTETVQFAKEEKTTFNRNRIQEFIDFMKKVDDCVHNLLCEKFNGKKLIFYESVYNNESNDYSPTIKVQIPLNDQEEAVTDIFYRDDVDKMGYKEMFSIAQLNINSIVSCIIELDSAWVSDSGSSIKAGVNWNVVQMKVYINPQKKTSEIKKD